MTARTSRLTAVGLAIVLGALSLGGCTPLVLAIARATAGPPDGEVVVEERAAGAPIEAAAR